MVAELHAAKAEGTQLPRRAYNHAIHILAKFGKLGRAQALRSAFVPPVLRMVHGESNAQGRFEFGQGTAGVLWYRYGGFGAASYRFVIISVSCHSLDLIPPWA